MCVGRMSNRPVEPLYCDNCSALCVTPLERAQISLFVERHGRLFAIPQEQSREGRTLLFFSLDVCESQTHSFHGAFFVWNRKAQLYQALPQPAHTHCSHFPVSMERQDGHRHTLRCAHCRTHNVVVTPCFLCNVFVNGQTFFCDCYSLHHLTFNCLWVECRCC